MTGNHKGRKECHIPVAVLEGRDGAALKAWLTQNKQVTTAPVEIKIPKDSASPYTEAAVLDPLVESGKKMREVVGNSTEYNPKSVQLYNNIREYAASRYSKRDDRSGRDQFYDDIIKEPNAGISRRDVYCHLLKKGYMGKRSAAYDCMNKIIKREHIDIAVYKSSFAEVIRKRKKLQ